MLSPSTQRDTCELELRTSRHGVDGAAGMERAGDMDLPAPRPDTRWVAGTAV